MNNGMVWTQVESPQICSNSSEIKRSFVYDLIGSTIYTSFSYPKKIQLPVKYPSFFEDVSEINIGIEKVRIQSYRLLKMVNGKPNLSLSIKNASKIAPCNSKIRSCFDGFQVTSLLLVETDVYV